MKVGNGTFDRQAARGDGTDEVGGLAWWEELRPLGWSLRQHLDNPTVNTTSAAESKLAECVAEAVQCGAI